MIRLYVIEYHDRGEPILYVGSTAKPVRVRFREHTQGKRKCGSCLVHRTFPRSARGFRLRSDLLPLRASFFSRSTAESHEKKLACRLRRAGHTVSGGH